MAKILITETVADIGPKLLTEAGHQVVFANRDMDIIRREIVNCDAVMVRIIELPGELLATAPNLKIVSKHGVGYDNIDLEYCKKAGVLVTTTPDANGLSVAEHAFTLMMALAKNLVPVAKAYKDIGTHGVVIAEPAAGLLSPALSEEFSAPYIRQITDALQDDDFIIIDHNCGDAAGRMIPEILQTGCAAYHFGNAMDMEKVLAQMPEDVLTMGNIDPVSVLRHGDPAKVREATLSLLEKCSKHKNFLISSGCDIPPATPWENIDAFFAAVEEFYNR